LPVGELHHVNDSGRHQQPGPDRDAQHRDHALAGGDHPGRERDSPNQSDELPERAPLCACSAGRTNESTVDQEKCIRIRTTQVGSASSALAVLVPGPRPATIGDPPGEGGGAGSGGDSQDFHRSRSLAKQLAEPVAGRPCRLIARFRMSGRSGKEFAQDGPLEQEILDTLRW
jgi:hypothetical protein